MSSPNEPGHPRAGEGSGPAAAPGPGSTAAGPDGGARPAHTAEAGGDVPPWQRGPAGRGRGHQAPESGQPDGSSAGAAPGLDARLNRFMAGSSAPAGSREAESASRNERNDRTDVVGRPEGIRPDAPRRPDEARRPDEPRRPDEARRADEMARPDEARRGDEARRPDMSGKYASEIPDLGPRPPQPQRKPVERPSADQAAKPAKAAPAGNRSVQVANRQHRGPVRASMQIRRVDPWSMLKVSLLLSVVLFFVWMIAVAFLYLVLGGMGVWSKLNSNVGDLLTSASGSSGGELVSSGTIFGGAALIGLVNIVLLTAAATLGAFIYNLTTDLVGGVEVTLADRD